MSYDQNSSTVVLPGPADRFEIPLGYLGAGVGEVALLLRSGIPAPAAWAPPEDPPGPPQGQVLARLRLNGVAPLEAEAPNAPDDLSLAAGIPSYFRAVAFYDSALAQVVLIVTMSAAPRIDLPVLPEDQGEDPVTSVPYSARDWRSHFTFRGVRPPFTLAVETPGHPQALGRGSFALVTAPLISVDAAE